MSFTSLSDKLGIVPVYIYTSETIVTQIINRLFTFVFENTQQENKWTS